MVVEIYNYILKCLKQEKQISNDQSLHLVTPSFYNDIVSAFANVGISSEILANIIAKRTQTNIYTAKDGENIIYKDDLCFIVGNVLYLVNPFDEKFKQSMVLKKKVKDKEAINFTKFGVCAYDSVHLTKDTAKKTTQDVNSNEIEILWQVIVAKAQSLNSSDIHFIPEIDTVKIGYRVFTTIRHNVSSDLSYKVYKKLINLLLTKSVINNGSFVTSNSGNFVQDNLSFRLETIPTNQHFDDGNVCPKATIRIHKAGRTIMSLEQLGLPSSQVNILQELSAFIGSKLLMIAGPTGSGKTTILYAILKEMQRYRVGIMINTLEDPPEINLPGVVQTPIDRVNKGNTWEAAIKSVLRSDPNVVLIGEIRDANTANCAIELATTGHVALSTIHTDTALGILTRLRSSFNIDDVVLAETLHTLIATRILQKPCKKCSIIKPINKHILNNLSQHYLHKYIDMGISDRDIRHANNEGCSFCHGGYDGIVPLIEVYQMDAQALMLIASKEPLQTLEKHFNKDAGSQINIGFWQGGINLLLSGYTTIDQLEHELPVYNDINNIVIPVEVEIEV